MHVYIYIYIYIYIYNYRKHVHWTNYMSLMGAWKQTRVYHQKNTSVYVNSDINTQYTSIYIYISLSVETCQSHMHLFSQKKQFHNQQVMVISVAHAVYVLQLEYHFFCIQIGVNEKLGFRLQGLQNSLRLAFSFQYVRGHASYSTGSQLCENEW